MSFIVRYLYVKALMGRLNIICGRVEKYCLNMKWKAMKRSGNY